jgi:predicted HTH domain antitoxin
MLKEPDQKELALKYIDLSTVSIDTASKLYSKHHSVSYEQASEILFKRLIKLESFYRADAKELFLRNGSYLSGHVWDDFDTCITVIESILKR